jgi:hypothetical protein
VTIKLDWTHRLSFCRKIKHAKNYLGEITMMDDNLLITVLSEYILPEINAPTKFWRNAEGPLL